MGVATGRHIGTMVEKRRISVTCGDEEWLCAGDADENLVLRMFSLDSRDVWLQIVRKTRSGGERKCLVVVSLGSALERTKRLLKVVDAFGKSECLPTFAEQHLSRMHCCNPKHFTTPVSSSHIQPRGREHTVRTQMCLSLGLQHGSCLTNVRFQSKTEPMSDTLGDKGFTMSLLLRQLGFRTKGTA